MNKKTATSVVIIIVVILLVAVISVYFGFFKKSSLRDIGKMEIPEIKMPFESGLGNLELSNFDIGASLPSDLFSNISVDTNLGGYKGKIGIGMPSFSIGNISAGTPPAGWVPDEATCNQFKAAPSCSFVPEQYRALCEQCKNK